jgi:hypothetical protein
VQNETAPAFGLKAWFTRHGVSVPDVSVRGDRAPAWKPIRLCTTWRHPCPAGDLLIGPIGLWTAGRALRALRGRRSGRSCQPSTGLTDMHAGAQAAHGINRRPAPGVRPEGRSCGRLVSGPRGIRRGGLRGRHRKAAAHAANKRGSVGPARDRDQGSQVAIRGTGSSVSAVRNRRHMVPGEGFEPPTFGLQNRCTTTVLTRQINGLGKLIVRRLRRVRSNSPLARRLVAASAPTLQTRCRAWVSRHDYPPLSTIRLPMQTLRVRVGNGGRVEERSIPVAA